MREIDGLLNIARKAGFVILGQDNLKYYDKKLYLLILDKTAGKALQREMQNKSKTMDVELCFIEDLGKGIGIENAKVVGIKNKAMAEKIAGLIKGE